MSVGALITADAIKRAEIIDAEMGWPEGLAIGRLARMWQEAQEGDGKSVVRKSVLLKWARVPAAEGDRFLYLCCLVGATPDDDHIHFLEPRQGDRYLIVGNSERIEKLEHNREVKSAAGRIGGVKSGESRRHKRDSKGSEADAEANAKQVLKQNPSKREADAEANAKQNRSPLPLSSPSPLALVLPEPLPDSDTPSLSQDARARVDLDDGREGGEKPPLASELTAEESELLLNAQERLNRVFSGRECMVFLETWRGATWLTKSRLLRDIVWIAEHPIARKETWSVARVFYADKMRKHYAPWDEQFRGVVLQMMRDGASPDGIAKSIVARMPGCDGKVVRLFALRAVDAMRPILRGEAQTPPDPGDNRDEPIERIDPQIHGDLS